MIPPARPPQHRPFLVAAILLVAALFRIPTLGHDSLWFDEALTHMIAGLPVSQVFPALRRWENWPPLYFYIINLWAHVFGNSDFMLRLPSALFAIASVAMMYRFARRLAPAEYADRFALIAALFLAISRYHIAYSQQARGYTMLFLLCLVSCDAFVRLIGPPETDRESNRAPIRRIKILYVLSSAAALWTHPSGGFVLLAQNLYYFGRMRASRPGISLRPWLSLLGLIVVLFSPWVGPMLVIARISMPWMREPHVADTILHYTDTTPLLFLSAILLLLHLWRAIAKRDATIFLALLLFVCPFAIPILLSTAKHPLFIPRYGITALIGLCLINAGGAVALRRRASWMIVIVFCSLSAPNLLHDLRAGTNAEFRAQVRPAAQIVTARAHPGDGIYTEIQNRVFFTYCTRSDVVSLGSLPITGTDAPAMVWFVVAPDRDTNQLLTSTPYRLVARYDFAGVSLVQARRSVDGK